MKRIISILSVVGLMAAMLALAAMPAFAQDVDVHPLNHGAVVSAAAHACPRGPGGVHGECVSDVAQQNP
jgi:hypothetical protein